MKSLAILLLVFLASVTAYPQSSVPKLLSKKCFGGSGSDKALDVLPLGDGGYIIVGETFSTNGDVSGHHGLVTKSDAWVARMDINHNILWQKSMGGSDNDIFQTILLAPDGNIICFGTTSSSDGDVSGNHGLSDLWVVKLSLQGNVQWSKCFGGTNNETFSNATQLSGGDFALLSLTQSTDGDLAGAPYFSQWVFRMNQQGAVQWKCFLFMNSPIDSYISSTGDITQVNSGEIVAVVFHAGEGGNLNGHSNDFVQRTARINADNGSVISAVNSGLDGRASNSASIGKTPNGYILSVYKNFYFAPTNQGYQTRITSNMHFQSTTQDIEMYPPRATHYEGPLGNNYLMYETVYGSPHAIFGVDDSTYVGVGDLYDLGAGPTSGTYGGRDAAIGFGRFNTSGYTYVTENFGGSGADKFTSVKKVSDNEYIVCGFTSSTDVDAIGNHGDFDCWVVRVKVADLSNTIKGNIFIDANSNGVKDAGEKLYTRATVRSVAPNYISESVAQSGVFSNKVDSGVYTSTINFKKPYYTAVPTSKTSTFVTQYSTDSFDFAIKPIPGKKDLQIAASTLTLLRPGFDNVFQIRYANVGTETLSGTVTCIKDNRNTYLQILPAPDITRGDTLIWNFTNLKEEDTGYIQITMHLAPPPTVSLGDMIAFKAIIDPVQGDETPANNAITVYSLVVSSLDPNDITESNSGTFTTQQLATGEDLLYQIRFQNTGTDTAFNIRVLDTLPAKLNGQTFEMVAASHPYTLTIRNGNIYEWNFRNILLADSNRNEPLSHGYILYRVRPMTNLVPGDKILNSASIYFDYNLSVQTNIHQTEIKLVAPALVQPQVTGVATSYCAADPVQKGRLLNPPATGSGFSVTIKLDSSPLTLAADSTFSFTIIGLSAGAHAITVSYSDGTNSKTTNLTFAVNALTTPDVNLSASVTNVTNLVNPVVITASNVLAGGSAPLYTFGKNRGFTSLWQAESSAAILTITPSSLTVGDNWIFVRMKSNATCVSAEFAYDSIRIVRDMSTGIVDPDNPGKIISVYPNPLTRQFYLKGLDPTRKYRVVITNLNGQVLQQSVVANQASAGMVLKAGLSGSYLLSLYDDRKNKLIGTLMLVRQ